MLTTRSIAVKSISSARCRRLQLPEERRHLFDNSGELIGLNLADHPIQFPNQGVIFFRPGLYALESLRGLSV